MATTDGEPSPNVYTKSSLILLSTIMNGTFLLTDTDLSLSYSQLVSEQLKYVIIIVNYVVLCALVSLFGIAANAINILVFIRQGFKETITISLFGMGISDLVLQVMTLWVSVSSNPWLENANIPFKGLDLFFFMGGWIQVITTRITSWITAFVTLERCLCIIVPLKVKYIITTSRTKAVVGSIFFASTLCVLPVYFTIDIQWVFNMRQNRSLLNMIQLESRQDIQNTMYFFNNVASPLGSFAVVFICTLVLSLSMNRTARWRSKFTMTDETGKTKDQKVVKMVTLLAGVYIICYTPTIGLFMWQTQDPELSHSGTRRDLLVLTASFAFLLESVNSSINIFFYYSMSSKYRDTFQILFKTQKLGNKIRMDTCT